MSKEIMRQYDNETSTFLWQSISINSNYKDYVMY